MRRFLPLLSLFGLVLLLASCHEDPYLTVTPSNLSFPEEGGAQTIQVSANYAWTASVSGSGFKISPASGEGVGSVTVTASAASSSDEVTGSVSFQSEGLTASVALKQSARTTLEVGSVTKIPQEGGTVTVDVRYNTEFTVEIESSAQSWISFAGTKSLNSGKLTFEVKANETTDTRTGKVTVKDKSGKVQPQTLTFEQEEKKVIQVGETTTIPSEGGTYQVDVKYNADLVVEVEEAAKSWITFIQTKALKSGKLEFSFAANDGAERTGNVTVKDKNGKAQSQTLTFVQEEEKKVIKVGETPTIPAEGGTFTVDVEYNTDLQVEVEKSAQSWITFIQTKALKSGKLEFSFKANEGDERTGKVTVKDKNGKASSVTLTFVQQKISEKMKAYQIMDAFYEALNGQKWSNPWIKGKTYPGFYYDDATGESYINLLNETGIKGTIPESIGELTGLKHFIIWNAPGLSGTLPDSFRKLVNLTEITFIGTSMTSVPDIFADLKKLERVQFNNNEKMTGPLPESIGSSPVLERLAIVSNMFSGGLPASWARLSGKFFVGENCLTGKLPAEILATNNYVWLQEEVLPQREGYGFDISDVDLHGGRFWPEGMVKDLAGGEDFSFEDVIKKNKYTVFLDWSTWDPFSKSLMFELNDLFDLYHNDGLAIIATIMVPQENISQNDQKNEITKRGCDGWHHYYFPSYSGDFFPLSVPNAEVYDSKGNIVFSSLSHFPDPVRQRFDKIAYYDLIPFLLGKFEAKPYTSTDYSKDGEVTTLQKATVGKGINIVFMGDAFTDRDMGKGGIYETIMSQAMEEFFAIEPYKTFRNRFNVYAIKVVSPNGRVGEGYTTALESYIGEGTLIEGNLDKSEQYSLKVPSISDTENLLTCVMVKSSKYAGTCVMSRVKQSAVALTSTERNDKELFGNTLRHEAGGHGFGFLADEYVYYDWSVPANKKEEYTYLYEQFGWYSNVDFTADPKKVHWSAFLSDDRYKNEVGVFEGAALYGKDIWRPSENSMMNENLEYYNAPSRWAIYQRIMKLSGETPSFDKFLEYDAVNRGAAAKAAVTARPPYKDAGTRPVRHTAPPVIVP